MAAFAKILGVLCLLVAAGDLLLGAYVYTKASSAADTTGIAVGLGVVYLAGASVVPCCSPPSAPPPGS